jgi:hypothetical protein
MNVATGVFGDESIIGDEGCHHKLRHRTLMWQSIRTSPPTLSPFGHENADTARRPPRLNAVLAVTSLNGWEPLWLSLVGYYLTASAEHVVGLCLIREAEGGDLGDPLDRSQRFRAACDWLFAGHFPGRYSAAYVFC